MAGDKVKDGGVTVDNSGLDKVELKRTLGLFSGCAMILGTIIGSGIFVSPKGVLIETGSVGMALVVWALTGVLVLFGALCYAELGTLIPKSGGAYAYIQEGFGDMPAFLFMWATAFIVLPTGNAVIALTFAQYALQPFYPTCETPQTAILMLAALAMLLLSFINAYSAVITARIQGFFMVVKILALLLIIITGIVVLFEGGYENFQNAFAESTMKPGKIAIAFYSGLFSYAGWDALNFLTEELKSPYKNLPRAILISLPLVTVIYVLANVAYFAVLGASQVLESDAVAVTFAMKKFGVMAWIMPILVAFSTFGSLNGCIMCVGRLFFVGARGGHLPDAMALINIKTFTPMPAIILLALLSITMLFLGDVYTLINYATFVESLCFAVCVCVLLYFRWKKPDLHRPIKVPIIIPIIFLIVCIFILVLPIYTSPDEVAMAIVLLLSGIPVYVLGIVWSNKPVSFQKRLASFTRLVQKVTYSCEQED